MTAFRKLLEYERPIPTLAAATIVLLAAWMGNASGGYFPSAWIPPIFIMAGLLLIASIMGVFRRAHSWWSVVALALLTSYAAWTFISLAWSANKGDAWLGAGQTLLYLLVFWITTNLVALGASRRWIFAASVIGTTAVAAITLAVITSRADELFTKARLVGTVGYYNGEAAFLLVPFWTAIYLAGSRRVHPLLRGVSLAGAAICVSVATLTQSRGAMVAMAASVVVFFLLSGQRLRGLLALVPVAAALLISFPALNEVYLDFLEGNDPFAALSRMSVSAWLAALGAGIYGFLWGIIDRRWRPPIPLVKLVGSLAIASSVILLAVGVFLVNERIDDPGTFVQQRWEAFKTNDQTGQQQSRYLSASGQGRYTYWQVAWQDFTSHPLIGVGTHNYEATYYQLRNQPAGWVRQPHNLTLEILAERGIVGGVLFFGFMSTCLVAGLWKRFSYLSSEGKGQVGAMSAAITYWFVHSSSDWFWQLPAITLPAIVYLAVLAAPWKQIETPPLQWPLRTVGAGVAVLAIVAVAPLYIADRYLAQSEAYLVPGQAPANPWMALSAVDNAQKFNPVDPQLQQREAELALSIGDWARAERAYRTAIELNPQHFGPYQLLGAFYEKKGDTEDALSFYRKALSLNPLDPALNKSVGELSKPAAVSGDKNDPHQ